MFITFITKLRLSICPSAIPSPPPHVRNGYQVNDKRNLKKIDVNPGMGKNPIQVGWVCWGRGGGGDGLVIPLANKGVSL